MYRVREVTNTNNFWVLHSSRNKSPLLVVVYSRQGADSRKSAFPFFPQGVHARLAGREGSPAAGQHRPGQGRQGRAGWLRG